MALKTNDLANICNAIDNARGDKSKLKKVFSKKTLKKLGITNVGKNGFKGTASFLEKYMSPLEDGQDYFKRICNTLKTM